MARRGRELGGFAAASERAGLVFRRRLLDGACQLPCSHLLLLLPPRRPGSAAARRGDASWAVPRDASWNWEGGEKQQLLVRYSGRRLSERYSSFISCRNAFALTSIVAANFLKTPSNFFS